jgi:anti-sigma B factor antagonist
MALQLKIKETSQPGSTRISLAGDLDSAGGKQARRQLARVVKSGRTDLTIDLNGVGDLSSAGLAALIATLRLARDAGGNVTIEAAKEPIRRILELTGLSRVFRLQPQAAHTTQAAPAA